MNRSNLDEIVALPWAGISQRWGHPWHSMCSYLGTFPPVMARALVEIFSDVGDYVFDPFSGRGTTILEARLLNRRARASDMNPLAVALSAAKSATVTQQEVLGRIAELESRFDPVLYASEAHAQPDSIQLIYHSQTLAQLCFLRRRLMASKSSVDVFLVGAVLGVMHGGERQDGGSAYASISMPNTFSMSPEYVRRFVQDRHLQRVPRDLFGLLRAKCERLFQQPPPGGPEAVVWRADAKSLASSEELKELREKIDLVVTSPPYLNVVNYALQNWIRLWFLDEMPEEVDGMLDDHLMLGPWLEFMDIVVEQLRCLVSRKGCIVLVIGDVAKSASSIISPARELIRRVRHRGIFGYVGCAVDRLNTDEKVSRIWKNTRGKATAIDRVVVLAHEVPSLRKFDASVFGLEDSLGNSLDPTRLAEYAARYAGDEAD